MEMTCYRAEIAIGARWRCKRASGGVEVKARTGNGSAAGLIKSASRRNGGKNIKIVLAWRDCVASISHNRNLEMKKIEA